DAAGFDLVLVETVGVGQSELGVMEVADTAVVVLTPESGDSVPALKAALLEVADLVVVTKADRPGADRLARQLRRSSERAYRPRWVGLAGGPGWRPPVLLASALEDGGVEAVAGRAAEHLAWSGGEGREAGTKRRGDALVRLCLDLVAERARAGARLALAGELE